MPTPTPGGLGSCTARGCFIYTPAAEEKQAETPYETADKMALVRTCREENLAEESTVTCSGGTGKTRDSDERGEMHAGRIVHIRLRTVGHSPRMSRRTGRGEERKNTLTKLFRHAVVPAVTQANDVEINTT